MEMEPRILRSVRRDRTARAARCFYTSIAGQQWSDRQRSSVVARLTAWSSSVPSFVPQAMLTLRTRDVSGISLGMYSAFTAGIACWLVYGCLLNAWPIVIANAITLVLAAAILFMKLRFR